MPDQSTSIFDVHLLPQLPPASAAPIFVDSAGSAQSAFATLAASDIIGMAIDSEYKPAIRLYGNGKRWEDVPCRTPLLLSVATLMNQQSGTTTIQTHVFDLRLPETHLVIQQILRLPETLVLHGIENELITLDRCGIRLPSGVFDTQVAQRILNLGRLHQRAKPETPEAAQQREKKVHTYSLLGACQQHSVNHGLSGGKVGLQSSFLYHPDGTPFKSQQIAYAAEDAVATLRIWGQQIRKLWRLGQRRHALELEMPAARILAQMTSEGIAVDTGSVAHLRRALAGAEEDVRARLAARGLSNPSSVPQTQAFLSQLGLANALKRSGRISTKKEALEAIRLRHPAIDELLEVHRIGTLTSHGLLQGGFISGNGRVYPRFVALASDTGRTQTANPNIQGLPSFSRPLVIADPDKCIISFDYAQQEIGIAAGLSGDEALIADFNQGDIYVAVAKRLFASRLNPKDLLLDDAGFRQEHEDLRAATKPIVLGIVYRKTAKAIAAEQGWSVLEAQHRLDQFLGAYPSLKAFLSYLEQRGTVLGYSRSASGLRRYRARAGQPHAAEIRQFRNTPVQATGADIYKQAMILVDPPLRALGGRLLLPLHDALVIEVPKTAVADAAAITRSGMIAAMRRWCPRVNPRIDQVGPYPCWCKHTPTSLVDFINRHQGTMGI